MLNIFLARVLNREKLQFGKGRIVQVNDRCDWGREATNNEPLRSVHIDKWAIVFCKNDLNEARAFAESYEVSVNIH